MAKTKTKSTKDLAKKESAEIAVVHDYGELAGEGFKNQTSNDIAIPFLSLLQALSPEVDKDDPKFIKNAVPGDLINSVTQELLDKDGVYIIPCETRHVYVEWVPRKKGGGFVGMHEPNSELVIKAKEATSNMRPTTVDGNDLTETFYMYCLLIDGEDATESVMPIVMAFNSTKIKVYKQTMLKLRTVKGQPPLFAFRLKVTSRGEKNKVGEPYKNFVIELVGGSAAKSLIDPNGDQKNLLVEGKALLDAVSSGIAEAVHTSNPDNDKGDGDIPF